MVEHQNESIAAAVALAAVVLPAPRRFLLRNTLGRLRSEEVSASWRCAASIEWWQRSFNRSRRFGNAMQHLVRRRSMRPSHAIWS